MKVAVLGCGPAGLMAVHACCLAGGIEVACFSRAKKSPLYGAQYLHQPIPGIEHDPTPVAYELRGEAGDYRTKVYGDRWDGTVSPEDLLETHDAWDIRMTYDVLWDEYNADVNDTELTPAVVNLLTSKFDLVINTIPLELLCMRGHTFGAAPIWAAGEAPDLGITLPYQCPPFTVICNGEESPSWYRVSNVYGYKTVEWPANVEPFIPSASIVRKPLFHNCDCWPDILKVGRFGSWTKGVLSHEAFNDTMKELMP